MLIKFDAHILFHDSKALRCWTHVQQYFCIYLVPQIYEKSVGRYTYFHRNSHYRVVTLPKSMLYYNCLPSPYPATQRSRDPPRRWILVHGDVILRSRSPRGLDLDPGDAAIPVVPARSTGNGERWGDRGWPRLRLVAPTGISLFASTSVDFYGWPAPTALCLRVRAIEARIEGGGYGSGPKKRRREDEEQGGAGVGVTRGEQEEDVASVKKEKSMHESRCNLIPSRPGLFFCHYETTGLKLVVLELTWREWGDRHCPACSRVLASLALFDRIYNASLPPSPPPRARAAPF